MTRRVLIVGAGPGGLALAGCMKGRQYTESHTMG